MDIQKAIEALLINTEEIKKNYPTVTNVRHNLKDVPYADLKEFARQHNDTIRTDATESRAYIIYSPLVNGKMDTDIWLYSTVVKIKPVEIIEI